MMAARLERDVKGRRRQPDSRPARERRFRHAARRIARDDRCPRTARPSPRPRPRAGWARPGPAQVRPRQAHTASSGRLLRSERSAARATPRLRRECCPIGTAVPGGLATRPTPALQRQGAPRRGRRPAILLLLLDLGRMRKDKPVNNRQPALRFFRRMRVKRRLKPRRKRREELGEPLRRDGFRRIFNEIIIDRLSTQDIAGCLGGDRFLLPAQFRQNQHPQLRSRELVELLGWRSLRQSRD